MAHEVCLLSSVTGRLRPQEKKKKVFSFTSSTFTIRITIKIQEKYNENIMSFPGVPLSGNEPEMDFCGGWADDDSASGSHARRSVSSDRGLILSREAQSQEAEKKRPFSSSRHLIHSLTIYLGVVGSGKLGNVGLLNKRKRCIFLSRLVWSCSLKSCREWPEL